MPGYWVELTNERVGDGKPELITRFKWRASLKLKSLCKRTEGVIGSYRWEMEYDENTERWLVVAMQNKLHYTTEG